MAVTLYDKTFMTPQRRVVTQQKYIIDSSSDVSNLPGTDECAAGSFALDASTGDIYIMNSSGVWNKVVR